MRKRSCLETTFRFYYIILNVIMNAVESKKNAMKKFVNFEKRFINKIYYHYEN